MRGSGVLMGIVWINMCFVINFQAKIMIITHIENVRGNEMVMWAVGVNIKGNRDVKFKIKIIEKIILIK